MSQLLCCFSHSFSFLGQCVCCSGCPSTYYVDQAGLNITELGLKVSATVPGHCLLVFILNPECSFAFLQVWDLRQNKLTYTMRGHADSVTGLSLSSEGSYLLSNAMDNTGNFGKQLFWGWHPLTLKSGWGHLGLITRTGKRWWCCGAAKLPVVRHDYWSVSLGLTG